MSYTPSSSSKTSSMTGTSSVMMWAVMVLGVVLQAAFSATAFVNVYNETLTPCSIKDGNMALTGFTRTGECVERQDDAGSHHICIDLSSTINTGGTGNFCQVTGQSNWCGTDMECHSSTPSATALCPVKNWCVCQWAFASYVEAADGCDNIQTIQCDATNREALLAYQAVAGTAEDADGKYTKALECLESRCNLGGSTDTTD
jgi:uncharacterized protein (DUF2237 family)